MPSEFTREDYEHAARAAWLELWSGQSEDVRNGCLLVGQPFLWNPPENDGDSLRLLCVCSMRIVEGRSGAYRAVQYTIPEGVNEGAVHEEEIEWPHTPAAHRYAFFRAAIEIGKNMKGTP